MNKQKNSTTKSEKAKTKKENKLVEQKTTSRKKLNLRDLKSSDTRLFLGVFGFVIVLAVLALGVFFITKKQFASNEIGIEIPNDYETYENDMYTIGYPKGFKGEERDGSFTVTKDLPADEALNPLAGGFANLAVAPAGEDLLQLQGFSIDTIKDVKCHEYKKTLDEQLNEQMEETSGQAEAEVDVVNILLNGNKGCEISISAVQTGFEAKIVYYLVLGTEDKVYSVAVTSFGQSEGDYDSLLNASKTFSLKE